MHAVYCCTDRLWVDREYRAVVCTFVMATPTSGRYIILTSAHCKALGCFHNGTVVFNTLRPRQNGRHFPDDIFKFIFLNENGRISIKISLKFVPKVPINNILALVQIMAWRRQGDKPLSEPMAHICVTRPQWVKHKLSFLNRTNVTSRKHTSYNPYRLALSPRPVLRAQHVHFSWQYICIWSSSTDSWLMW